MNIGFDAKRAFYNNTGLGNYSRDTIRILSNYFPENNYFLYSPKAIDNDRLTFLHPDNIFVKTPNRIIDKSLKSLWRTSAIKRDLSKDNIEIYHGLSHELPIGIEKTNIKSIVTIHDLIFLRYPQFFRAIDNKIYYQKFYHSCKVADKIIAVSEQTKKDIIDFFKINPEKIEVVYQGCNEAFKESQPLEVFDLIRKKHRLAHNYLLYVGSIEERKNLLTILKCLKDLPNQNLLIIGNGKEYKNKCLDYIKSNKLESQVTILSGLSLKELAGIYQNAQMLVYPSLFEGFGIPIIEALFCKIPVITSKNGCFSEAGGPSSIYIEPTNTEQMREAILSILNDEEKRKTQIELGLKHAQKFNDNIIAKKLISIYRDL
jgi:glycosyltransferase involved in cell wall biosynthesis